MDEAKRDQRQKWSSMHQAGQIAHQEALLALEELKRKAAAAAEGVNPYPSTAEFEEVMQLFEAAAAKRAEADACAIEFFGPQTLF